MGSASEPTLECWSRPATRLVGPADDLYDRKLAALLAGGGLSDKRGDVVHEIPADPPGLTNTNHLRRLGEGKTRVRFGFLAALGGARRPLMPYVSSPDLRQFSLIGLQVIVNAVLVGIGVGGFVAQLSNWAIGLVLGMLALLLMASFDALSVTFLAARGPGRGSSHRPDSRASKHPTLGLGSRLAVRFAVALALASLISTMLLFSVFKQEIDLQVASSRTELAQVLADERQVPFQPALAKLDSEINDTSTQISRLTEEMRDEAAGAGPSGVPGEGQLYKQLARERDHAVDRLQDLQQERLVRLHEISADRDEAIRSVTGAPVGLLEKIRALDTLQRQSGLYILAVWAGLSVILALASIAPGVTALRLGRDFERRYQDLEQIEQRMAALTIRAESVERAVEASPEALAEVIDLRRRIAREEVRQLAGAPPHR